MPLFGAPILDAPRAILFDIGRVIINVNYANSAVPLGRGAGRSDSQIMKDLEADPRWRDWQEGRVTPRDWHLYFKRHGVHPSPRSHFGPDYRPHGVFPGICRAGLRQSSLPFAIEADGDELLIGNAGKEMQAPSITGDECPFGKDDFQRTYCCGPISVGRTLLPTTRAPLGPRN